MNQYIRTIMNYGSSGIAVEVECTITNGLPQIVIIGLGNKAIDEARERLRNAFTQSGITFPKKRITINLAPADIPKYSSNFDVAIAISICISSNILKYDLHQTSSAYFGEIGLDGRVRPVRGIIGKVAYGKTQGIKTFYVPAENVAQAMLVQGVSIIGVSSLRELVAILQGTTTPNPPAQLKANAILPSAQDSFTHIAGQETAKRALIIAAAGRHNVLLTGPPGSGKSMLARALPQLLPPPTAAEITSMTHLHSLVGADISTVVRTRPFRSPHHSASLAALIGGGQQLRPGEISLSNHGVLFLDELPEFRRDALEALRQPLEDRSVTITRVNDSVRYPADFILAATANPCPCGYYGSQQVCACTASQLHRYRQKISGPLMDRIDLHVPVTAIDHPLLLHPTNALSQAQAQAAVILAHTRQLGRGMPNSLLSVTDIRDLGLLPATAETFLNGAAKSLQLSSRGYLKVVRVAQTVADLEAADHITNAHISEALRYRQQHL